MAAQRVLIVEDDFLVRLTLAEALLSDGFDVVEAETGEEALRMLREDPGIGLLLTDMQLGGAMNGQQLAAAARAERSLLPVLYTTGRPDLVQSADGVRERVLPKPYMPAAVCAAVRELLAL